jgi:hypothetical protein
MKPTRDCWERHHADHELRKRGNVWMYWCRRCQEWVPLVHLGHRTGDESARGRMEQAVSRDG